MARVVSLALAFGVAAKAGEHEAREAPLYAAALIHLAKAHHCTAVSRCCYSVGKKVPSPELKKLLATRRELRPIAEQSACAELTIDVQRTTGSGTEQRVWSGVGAEGSPIAICTHTLFLKAGRWMLEPSKDDCPTY